MLDWMFISCENKTIFFAHNLTFDGSLILNSLDKNTAVNNFSTHITRGRIYSLSIQKKNINLIFRCSLNFLPLDLQTIAEKMLLPQKLKFDHNNVDSNNFNERLIKENAKKYCERDALIVHRFMVKLHFSLNKYLPWWWVYNFTISSVAMQIFLKNYNKFNLDFNLSEEEDNIFRQAYYGGRCEVFGNAYDYEKIFHFDFSSMYAHRLKEKYPYGYYKKNNSPTQIGSPGFYYVKIFSNMKIPVLPYRCPHTNKLFFPNGTFSGLYWYEELLLFKEAGGQIVEYRWSIEFEKEDFLFKDFAEETLKRRKDSITDNILWKLIPNSFVGRLGLKAETEKSLIIEDADYDPLNKTIISDKKINNQWIVRVQTFSQQSKMKNNVMYPAIVASKARILWWKSAIKIIEDGGRLLYCDTDSIFAAFTKNVINTFHGEIFWSSEKEDTIIDDACFATSKVYSYKYKNNTLFKIKGIPRHSINMSFENFKKLFYSTSFTMHKFNYFNKRWLNMKIEDVTKKIDFGGYNKRLFSKNKKETKPLFIYENTLYKKKWKKFN